MNIRSIILIAMSVMLAVSCTKDTGNYDYTELEDISITGITTDYYFGLNRTGIIEPVITVRGQNKLDSGRYKYEWILDHAIGFPPAKFTLSARAKLDTLIVPARGCASYYCYFRVTDTATGVFTQKDFRMHVSTPTYEGWLLLCEPTPGNSRLDMISMSGDRDTLYKDVLSAVGSSYKLRGAPAFVTCGLSYFAPANGGAVPFVGTSEDATILGGDTLNYSENYSLNNFVTGEKINSFAGSRFMGRFQAAILQTPQTLYYAPYDQNQPRLFRGPVNVYQGMADFIKISRHAAYDWSGGNWIFFDETAKRFIRYTAGLTYCRTMAAGTLFDYDIDKNVTGGMSMVHFESIVRSSTSSEVFAVLKANASGKYYLSRFNLTGTAQTFFGEMTNATDIDKATHFAVSPEYGYIFYVANGILYEYDHLVKKAFKMQDFGTRKVSYMEFPYFTFSDVARWGVVPLNYDKYSAYRRRLVVATYDESDTETSGKLDVFNVPGVNMPIQVFKSYSGLSKIASLGFRER